jgi:hypothetical protein
MIDVYLGLGIGLVFGLVLELVDYIHVVFSDGR